MPHRLSRERWEIVSPYLDCLLDLPDGQRADWIASLREEDAALAAELRVLLDEHEALEERGFLDGGAPVRRTAPSLTGQTVGAYTLESLIGQGGMGSVWLASRSDGRFEGVVAVKLLDASRMGRGGEARFRREGSFLARLRHPHIAHLIDAGVSAAGQPYLVLEHVDGERIDTYCDNRNLTIEARLRLFLDVLAAVAHAHGRLIVHRDLKPSNVLVARDGTVKLLDFGIAKLLETDGDPGWTSALTREGEVVMTPEYAAPEQLRAEPITTTTDVYALGLLLYVLLAGRHPAGTFASSPAERIKAVLDTEAAPVSVAVAVPHGPGAAPPAEIAARRATTPKRLRAALRGDLDNIVARALKKAPAERYPSVEALADDVRRYLRNEPVSARADSVAYRANKFVRRHRGGVAAAALVVAAAAAGTAGIAWQSREAQRQRDAAQTRLARVTATNEFMGFLLSVAAPGNRPFTVAGLLEQGEALVDRQFAGNDAMRVDMLVTIGLLYVSSERWDRATPVLERAAGIASRSADVEIQARAQCPLSFLKMTAGAAQEARALVSQALARLPDDPQYTQQRAECLGYVAAFSYLTGDADAMIRNASAALTLLDRTPTSTPWQKIDAQASLAYGYYLARQNRKADETYARISAAMEQIGRGRTLAAADVLNNWALVHYQGDIARAEPLYARAVALRRSIEGADAISPSMSFNYAGALLRLGRYAEAEPLFEETIRTAAVRQEHRIQFDAMMQLSELHLERGDAARAAAQLAAVAPVTAHPRFDVMRRAQLAYYEGRLAQARGDHAAARARVAAAVAAVDTRKWTIAMHVLALAGLARAEAALGDAPAADASARRAVALAESLVDRDAPSYLVGLAHLAHGDVRHARGETRAAQASFGTALHHLARTLGPQHASTRAARLRTGGPASL